MESHLKEPTPLRPEDLGARERGKLERRKRIERAAREIFEKAGYEGTTMRAIAKRARVGIGTLFRHAQDKSELLLLILNDDLEAITEKALATIDPDGDLLEELLKIFRPRYEYWESAPEPALYALLEVRRLRPGPQTDRYIRRRRELIGRIAEIVARQQELGRIRADREPLTIARLLTVLYLAEARLWLRESELGAEAGLAQLADSLRLVIAGLGSEAATHQAKPGAINSAAVIARSSNR